MRISDWSSDVCSSDLRIRQRTLLRERFSREVTLQPKDITITSSDERFLQKAMDIVESNMGNFEFNVQAFNGEMEIGRTQEIGRASCRERVSVRVALGGRRIITKTKTYYTTHKT